MIKTRNNNYHYDPNDGTTLSLSNDIVMKNDSLISYLNTLTNNKFSQIFDTEQDYTQAPVIIGPVISDNSQTTGPTQGPIAIPTQGPTQGPFITQAPIIPTTSPSVIPSVIPTQTQKPIVFVTQEPTNIPATYIPTYMPDTLNPAVINTQIPTQGPINPTIAPTFAPTQWPTFAPTQGPTIAPTFAPTFAPTQGPTIAPTFAPTFAPTQGPTIAPTFAPTQGPINPTIAPTFAPTITPTQWPTIAPTFAPTQGPTIAPIMFPTQGPTFAPTQVPTNTQTQGPTQTPTQAPSVFNSITQVQNYSPNGTMGQSNQILTGSSVNKQSITLSLISSIYDPVNNYFINKFNPVSYTGQQFIVLDNSNNYTNFLVVLSSIRVVVTDPLDTLFFVGKYSNGTQVGPSGSGIYTMTFSNNSNNNFMIVSKNMLSSTSIQLDAYILDNQSSSYAIYSITGSTCSLNRSSSNYANDYKITNGPNSSSPCTFTVGSPGYYFFKTNVPYYSASSTGDLTVGGYSLIDGSSLANNGGLLIYCNNSLNITANTGDIFYLLVQFIPTDYMFMNISVPSIPAMSYNISGGSGSSGTGSGTISGIGGGCVVS